MLTLDLNGSRRFKGVTLHTREVILVVTVSCVETSGLGVTLH